VRALIDTSALLALSRSRDQYHAQAIKIGEAHLATGGTFVGTSLILGELHSHLLYLRGGVAAREMLMMLLEDPAHEWVGVNAELVKDASSGWLSRFADQSFSLVDAVSFEVMRREKLTHAFAFDHHFEVAGFLSLR
jgi:predicted nucleic acid-binding protein